MSHAVELSHRITSELFDIVSVFDYAADSARSRAAAMNPPAIEWISELVPYTSYKTPAGRFYRYTPFHYAQINLAGNVARAQQITAKELNAANLEAQKILTEVAKLVERLKGLSSVEQTINSASPATLL